MDQTNKNPVISGVGNPEYISEPGDVITEEITFHTSSGTSYDLTNFVLGTTLFEDLFSNVLMGTVVITDSGDLLSKLAVQGNEFITISFRTPGFTERISKSFYVTKIGDLKFLGNDRAQTYTISFMSIEGFQDNNIVISKKFSGSASDIVDQVFTRYLASPRQLEQNPKTSLIISPPSDASNLTVVSASWNPFKLINWCTNRAFVSMTSAPNYLFFESNKSYYFTSIENMIESQVTSGNIFAEYVYSPIESMKTQDKESKYRYVKPEIMKQYGIVRNMKTFDQLDIIEGQDFGYFASRLYVVDMTLKQYQNYPFNYHDKFKGFTHLEQNNNAPFNSSLGTTPDNMRSFRTSQYKVHNDSVSQHYEKWALERNSLMYGLSSLKLEIEVPGRTDIEVGRVINFLYPRSGEKLEGKTLNEMIDPYLSGLYIVTAIRHNFTLNKHTMYLEIAKDSYANPLG